MKEGNVLFKNALNTIYLWLYGVGHIVKEPIHTTTTTTTTTTTSSTTLVLLLLCLCEIFVLLLLMFVFLCLFFVLGIFAKGACCFFCFCFFYCCFYIKHRF